MSGPREQRLALPRLTLAARCWGDPQRPPLLALHGWLDNAGSFDRLAPLLDAWHVIAIDLPGHGRSDHRGPDGWYHYVDYFDEMDAIFAHFGWNRADLLGHSLGATLASLYAALRPERVGRLLLIEGLGPLAHAAEDAPVHLRRALDQRAAYAARRPLRVFATVDAAIAARTAAGDLDADTARPIVERGLVAVDGGYVWSSDPRLTLASPVRFTEAQVRAMLAGIRAPTTLVLAEPDTSYLPRTMIDARAACVVDLRVVRLPGRHHLHLEAAAAVAAALRGA